MSRENKILLLVLALSFALTGCVVRTYPVTKDRVDQERSGNRGYLKGSTGYEEQRVRKATRTTQAVEIELYPPVRFEKMPKAKPVAAFKPEAVYDTDREIYGNRGYITESISPEVIEPSAQPVLEKYTVQKKDTLQKISQKFYGTTKKWTKILKANEAMLKSPNKIYPGQVLVIPLDSSRAPVTLKETQQNLK